MYSTVHSEIHTYGIINDDDVAKKELCVYNINYTIIKTLKIILYMYYMIYIIFIVFVTCLIIFVKFTIGIDTVLFTPSMSNPLPLFHQIIQSYSVTNHGYKDTFTFTFKIFYKLFYLS